MTLDEKRSALTLRTGVIITLNVFLQSLFFPSFYIFFVKYQHRRSGMWSNHISIPKIKIGSHFMITKETYSLFVFIRLKRITAAIAHSNILFHIFLLSLTNFSKSLYVTLFGSIPSFLRSSISS